MDEVALNRIGARLAKFTNGFELHVEDFVRGTQHVLGNGRAAPICSCFKLALIDAYFEHLATPSLLDEEVVIEPTRFRIGGGVIRYFTTAVSFTRLQLLQLVLLASDSTATDLLLDEVGLDRVNAVLRRHESFIAMNVGDMVARFRALPGAQTCKEDGDADALRGASSTLGSTTARGLASLVTAVWTKVVRADVRKHYAACLAVDRIKPRSGLFLRSPRVFGKSGSLGFSFLMNDCGGVVDQDGAPRGAFGYTSWGWNLPSPLIDAIAGLIGIEIARSLGCAIETNEDWSPRFEELLR